MICKRTPYEQGKNLILDKALQQKYRNNLHDRLIEQMNVTRGCVPGAITGIAAHGGRR